MNRALTAVFSFVLALSALVGPHAGGAVIEGPIVTDTVPFGSFIFEENFEGANTPNPCGCYDLTSWTQAGGGASVYSKNTTSNACDTASLQIIGGTAGQFAVARYNTALTITNAYAHVRVMVDTILPTTDAQFLKFGTSTSTEAAGIFKAYFTTNGVLTVISGGATASTSATYTTNTYYHVWARWNSSGSGRLAFSTGTNEPTFGPYVANFTGGDTTSFTHLHCTTPGLFTMNFDTVKLKSGIIGDVDCE